MPDGPIKTDGSVDWSSGVNSVLVPTVASEANPNGLSRQALAWLVNATVRDGGITQRSTWNNNSAASCPLGVAANLLAAGLELYQGSIFYEPTDGTAPYIIALIGGRVLQIDPDFNLQPIDLTAEFNFVGALSPTSPKGYFCQAENYLVIQDGTEVNLPLFWDGQTLWQSNGITNTRVIGEPEPEVISFTTQAQWNTAALGATSVNIPLSAAYQTTDANGVVHGNVGDNIYLVTSPGGVYVGDFRVAAISPGVVQNIQLQSQKLANPPGSINAGPMTATIELPLQTNAGALPNPAGASAQVTLGVTNWIIPAVGKQVALLLANPFNGSVGDIVTVQTANQSITYGSFKVVSFDMSGNLRLQTISLAAGIVAGTSVALATLVLTTTGIRHALQMGWPTSNSWKVPANGGTAQIDGVRFAEQFYGTLYDYYNVFHGDNLTNFIGMFRLVQKVLPTDKTGQAIVLEAISVLSAMVGTTIPAGSISAQGVLPNGLIPPPSTFTQDIMLLGGPWEVPPLGGSANLQVSWNFPAQGVLTSYPGNVGDVITLTSANGVTNIGTFEVVSFDTNGDITLQTISSPYAGELEPGTIQAVIAITQVASTTGYNISQLPAARQMLYYMGRIFYNKGNVTNGGDIVGSTQSGTQANNYTDSVLSVTENPLVLGGDGFTLPTQSGDITGYAEPNSMNAALGQNLLLIGTRKAIYAMSVPVTRQDWIAANAQTSRPLWKSSSGTVS